MDFKLDFDEINYRIRNLSLTEKIIIINIFFHILTIGLALVPGFNLTRANNLLGSLSLDFVLYGQIWRIVTSGFLHSDLIHLAINMFSLWYIGRFVESFFGERKYFIVFTVSLIIGSLFSLMVDLLGLIGGTNVLYSSVGASGALFGLLGLLLGTQLNRSRYGVSLPINTNALLGILVLNLFIGFGANATGAGILINNAAHIGGLVGGFLMSLIIKPQNYFGTKMSVELIKWGFRVSLGIIVAGFIAQFIWLALFLLGI